MKISVFNTTDLSTVIATALQKYGHVIEMVSVSSDRHVTADNEEDQSCSTYIHGGSDISILCFPKNTLIAADSIRSSDAISAFASHLKQRRQFQTLVLHGFFVPGTVRSGIVPIIEKLSGKKAGFDFGVIIQPLFVRTGSEMQDYARPWIIVAGYSDNKARKDFINIYRSFDAPIEVMSLEDAEIQGLAHQLYNAVKIDFFHSLRTYTEKYHVDTDKIILAVTESAEASWNPVYGTHTDDTYDKNVIKQITGVLLEQQSETSANISGE